MPTIDGVLTPVAENYLPEGTNENYTGIFLVKHGGVCHMFKDVDPVEIDDRSFTLSFSVLGKYWVFFHDYVPDMYMHNREQLFAFKDNVVFKTNTGIPGQYFNTVPKPFFIDIVFHSDNDILLESVSWTSEYIAGNDLDQVFKTLTHISIWDSHQHTGRIPLTEIFSRIEYDNVRRTKGEWSLNSFRDILKTPDSKFIEDIFRDYKLISSATAPTAAWYNKGHLQDKWICIRFEFDNTQNAQLTLHDTKAQVLKTDR